MEPLSQPLISAVVQRSARILRDLGADIGSRPLVLPTGEFFPDAFKGDDKSVRRLVKRMRAHAGMDDIPIKVRVQRDETEASSGGGCGSGACGVPKGAGEGLTRLEDHGDYWIMNVPAAETSHPVALTANVARALGMIFLLETLEEGGSIDEPVEATADLTAVLLGFGPLLMEGSYIYSKSCGGPSVARVTALSAGELAVATALFVARGEHSLRRALKEVGPTQESLLQEAADWLKSNPDLVNKLRDRPASLAEGAIELSDPKPLLMRLFSKRHKQSRDELALSALEHGASVDELETLLSASGLNPAPAKSARRSAEDDELRSLVEEALNERRAGAE